MAYDYKFRTVAGMTRKNLYTNPTDPYIPTGYRYQMYTYAEGWQDVALPWYWKDCRSMDSVITSISYRYYGVKLGGQVAPVYSDPITVLKRKED